jgi:hypothetical protein
MLCIIIFGISIGIGISIAFTRQHPQGLGYNRGSIFDTLPRVRFSRLYKCSSSCYRGHAVVGNCLIPVYSSGIMSSWHIREIKDLLILQAILNKTTRTRVATIRERDDER